MAIINRNATDHFTKTVNTTDATATQIDAITIGADESGIITIKVVGFDKVDGAAVTGIVGYRYVKTGGTLTLGSAIAIEPIVADTAVSGGTFAASVVSNNIVVKVTGKASVNMTWISMIKQFALAL